MIFQFLQITSRLLFHKIKYNPHDPFFTPSGFASKFECLYYTTMHIFDFRCFHIITKKEKILYFKWDKEYLLNCRVANSDMCKDYGKQ